MYIHFLYPFVVWELFLYYIQKYIETEKAENLILQFSETHLNYDTQEA